MPCGPCAHFLPSYAAAVAGDKLADVRVTCFIGDSMASGLRRGRGPGGNGRLGGAGRLKTASEAAGGQPVRRG